MKKKFIDNNNPIGVLPTDHHNGTLPVRGILMILFILIVISCNDKKQKVSADHVPGTETTIDSSLAHLLRPVNEAVVAKTSTIKAESGTRIFSMPVQGVISYDTRSQSGISSRVAGRIERLYIKYNFQPVKKGQLILEIYSPDLAAAQRELLFIQSNDPNEKMLERAKQKLLLLGMNASQINQLINTKRIQYRVPVYSNASGYILEKSAQAQSSPVINSAASAGQSDDGMGMSGSSGNSNAVSNNTTSTSPLLLREGQYVSAGQSMFTIYDNKQLVAEFSFDPQLAASLKEGQKLVFRKSADPSTAYSGAIGLIQPTFREGSNFTIARVYLKDNRFQVGQIIDANIPIVQKGLWLPQAAVVQLGNRSAIFKKEGDVFVPKAITTGITAQGRVAIEEDISDWEVAANAAYLVDSESFIRLHENNTNK